MWASPVWSPAESMAADQHRSRIAYCTALNPLDSQASDYDLYLVDGDGSNETKLFPLHGEEGLKAPELAWSPWADGLLTMREGNLYLLSLSSGALRQLTADGGGTLPQWAK